MFNHLAENLETTLAERAELTRRLIALQDDERRHLARELHDEFGQCLAAIRALAASAGQTAAQDCPAVLSECESIGRTAAHMAERLRGALFRLRPPDADELGLAASLEGLFYGLFSRSEVLSFLYGMFSDRFEDLPATLGASLYRIAQEALTNAAKHAEARRVLLQVTKRQDRSALGTRGITEEIELTVEDDGRAFDPDLAVKPGMGLLGMRERVAGLGGRLSFEPGQKTGAVLRVAIPLTPAAACSFGAECPA